jgi:hypothetical protein
MQGPVVVREWNADRFHQRVLELQAFGYLARRETYEVTPEMNPETGIIIHLYSIEMWPPEKFPCP